MGGGEVPRCRSRSRLTCGASSGHSHDHRAAGDSRRPLPDLGDFFDEQVVVSSEPRERETRVFVAECDESGNIPTPPAVDEEWKPFLGVFSDAVPQQTEAPEGHPPAP